MTPRISVVIATRNRGSSLVRLLQQLDTQTIPPGEREVIVVDDGSPEPVAALLGGLDLRMPIRAERIPWSGPGAARHHGATLAEGEVLLFVDDDMQVEPGFLAAHLDYHERAARAVVLGRIDGDPALASMPLFERYHARQMDRQRAAMLTGAVPPRGVHLCTGNVSMRRADYLAVGGFNTTLERSEDRELGIRLEQDGCALIYGDAAVAVHCSDHSDLTIWMRRAFLYGRFDHKIARLHPTAEAHPWRFWGLIHPLSRPIVAIALVFPGLARVLARAIYTVATWIDRAGHDRPAVTLTALVYALEYFRGLRVECGSLSALRADIRATRSGRPPSALAECLAAIRADHDSLRFYRLKYHEEVVRPGRLPLDLVRKIGFQMLVWYRVMRLFRAWRVPLLPMMVSRLIRHLYGADIHWDTRVAPGVSIVHGMGLVLSHAAEVGPGCILFHNVTLGESVDPVTGAAGAPRLGPRVHVGPGATLLGPIQVGAGAKVAAGVVLMMSVGSDRIVMPPTPVVTSGRRARGSRIVPVRAGADA